MSKKGLSWDEKRVKLLELFHETKDFFILKELEKLAPKRGIVSQSVKEVLQSLVDDSLVTSEKIGTSIYFWSYPSASRVAFESKLEQKTFEASLLNTRRTETAAEIALEEQDRYPSDERTALLDEYAALDARLKDLKSQMAKYKDYDPVMIQQKYEAQKLLQQAALDCTEATSTIASMLQGLGTLEASAIRAHLEMTDDFEDLAFPAA